MPAKFAGYVICATPRSGSTLLCDLLAATGTAGKPNSFYREQSIPDFAREWGVIDDPADGNAFEHAYLAAALKAGTNSTGIFGLRLMFGSLPYMSAILDRLHPGLDNDRGRIEAAFGPMLYIHLSRDDKVAQAVSRLKAEQSGLWHRHADGSERERTQAPREPVYDAARLSAFLMESEADDAAWNSWFADHRIAPLRLVYETFSAAPGEALSTVLEALGLDPAPATAVRPRTAKLADKTSTDWAARFRAEYPSR